MGPEGRAAVPALEGSQTPSLKPEGHRHGPHYSGRRVPVRLEGLGPSVPGGLEGKRADFHLFASSLGRQRGAGMGGWVGGDGKGVRAAVGTLALRG